MTASGDTIRGNDPEHAGLRFADELLQVLDTIQPPFKIFYKNVKYTFKNDPYLANEEELPLDSLIVNNAENWITKKRKK